MHLVLRPLVAADSASAVTPIEVKTPLFAIGRREPVFAELPKTAVSRLSKRHARIFAEGGAIMLMDLGSLNGTLHNGVPLKESASAIQDGDRLSFGGLEFAVDVIEGPTAATQVRELHLVLIPERDGPLEPVVVKQFPFLISKQDPVFARFNDEYAEQLSYISRRHAHIFRIEDELYLEDLASTNGTLVNGELLEERIRCLKEGDSIGLGGEFFEYRVQYIWPQAESVEPDVSEALDSEHTIFVESATSFIDVYYKANAEAAGEAPKEEDAPGVAAKSPQPSQIVAAKRAFFGERIMSARAWAGLFIVLLLGGAGAGWYYYRDADRRALGELMAAEQYSRALAVANRMLANDPDNEAVQNQATEAMLLRFVPEWSAHYDAGDQASGAAVLDEARRLGVANPTDDAFIDLLGWTGTTRTYLAKLELEREEGTERPADPFTAAHEIEDLLDFWLSDTRQHTRRLGRVNGLLPDFASVYASIFADVRALRNLDLDAQILRELETGLLRELPDGQVDGVEGLIDDALSARAILFDVTPIDIDLGTYKQLKAALSRDDSLRAYEVIEQTGFRTAPFQAYGRSIHGADLPDADTVKTYREAVGLWREGRFEDSGRLLEALKGGAWNSMAEARLVHQEALLAEFEALRLGRDEPGYEQRLFKFYADLDQQDDRGLIAALKPDFLRHSQEAVRQSGALYRLAAETWRQYTDDGGIQTEHRLENTVSAKFKHLAGLIDSSVTALSRGLQIYAQLGLDPLPTWRQLDVEINREIAVQRSALENLHVIAPEVRAQKLSLLPTQ